MILHIVKCEMCENQFQFYWMQRWHERDVPATWLTVFEGKDIQGQEGWNFCSPACLQAWAARKDKDGRGDNL